MSEGGNRSQQSAAVLLQDELEAYCHSDSLSEEGLRELFARHGLTPGNQNRLSNYEFFTDAFYNYRYTEGIIRCLLEYFPDAKSATDEDGLSPLYYACSMACSRKNVTLSFIQLIVDADPVSVRFVDCEGFTPLHHLCDIENEQVKEATALEILNLLIDEHPEAVRHADNYGRLPIHLACEWRSAEFCQVLINAAPDSVRSVDNDGWTTLHHFLCCNDQVDDTAGMQVLSLLIEMCPEAVRHANNQGSLPLHYLCDDNQICDTVAVQVLNLLIDEYPEAASHANNNGYLPIHIAAHELRSPEFCRVLIEAYPGSVSMPDSKGELPLFKACSRGSLATVEYLYHQYPGAIDHATTSEFYRGRYPIHAAISRYDSATALKVVQFLLNCDPNQKLIQHQEKSLLHYAMRYNSSIQIIKVVYDAHPEAIENDRIASNIHRFDEEIQAFMNIELVYARQAQDHRLMMTPDDNGQLPLHKALQKNVRLGSIKLLINGNPSAVRATDNNLAMPLHIACEHHDSAGVVQCLIERHTLALEAVDRQGNTALHYACRGAKHDTIALLVGKTSVSKRNAHDKLPIHLLWESKEVSDRESVEYTESIFRLLRADPEMINQ